MDGAIISLKTRLFVYISHFLSAWGDRMWQFGIGLFLVELSPDSLQLVAIYGFTSGAFTLLLSTAIGDWVDRTARLKAARISLVTQNILVAVCAVVVFVVHNFLEDIKTEWDDEWLLNLCFAIIIMLGVGADLASVASTIVVERDWVVELCQGDTDLLGTMTSTLRTIDLTTKLLAPIVTGQVIYFLHIGWGGVFVAGWNAVSLVAEYYMIKKVYDQIPSLANEKFKEKIIRSEDFGDESAPLLKNEHSTDKVKCSSDQTIIVESETKETSNKYQQNGGPYYTSGEKEHSGKVPNGVHKQNGGPVSNDEDGEMGLSLEQQMKKESSIPSCCFSTFYSFIVLWKGWKTFMRYNVAFSGLGLAALYMTVLGFDNITVGYSYSQGISESLLGIFMAVGSIFGISGTFAYPFLRKRFGLKTTGLIGSLFQIVCLSVCVVSVFLKGSPFDLLHRLNEKGNTSQSSNEISTFSPDMTSVFTTTINSSVDSSTAQTVTGFLFENVTSTAQESSDDPESYLSIGIFLGGLIVARFGLWIFDLSVTQLFLQTVKERERGIVSGVQNSLNQLMDMLKALMVILAPYPEEFGLLTFISYGFVCLGSILYIKFLISNRGVSY